MRTTKKAKGFILAKQQLCTCITLFCTFLCRRCTTSKSDNTDNIDSSFVPVIPFSLENTGDLFPKAIKKEVISGFLIFIFLFQPVDKMSLGAGALKV